MNGTASIMETYQYPQFPTDLSVVHIALYTAVTNASLLRSRIIKASTIRGTEGDRERDTVNFAFIDARLVSPLKALGIDMQYSPIVEIR
jgi:EKC/KEOPS complex subunit CGI121/TPRKB